MQGQGERLSDNLRIIAAKVKFDPTRYSENGQCQNAQRKEYINNYWTIHTIGVEVQKKKLNKIYQKRWVLTVCHHGFCEREQKHQISSYKKSVTTGQRREVWTTVNIVPIFKKSNRSVLLTCIPKHLETSGYINNDQHRFRDGKSSLTNLL